VAEKKSGWKLIEIEPDDCHDKKCKIQNDLSNFLSLDNVAFLMGNGISLACNSPKIVDIYADIEDNKFKIIVDEYDSIKHDKRFISTP